MVHPQHTVPQRRPASCTRRGAYGRTDKDDGRRGEDVRAYTHVVEYGGALLWREAHPLREPDVREQTPLETDRPETQLRRVDSQIQRV